jgi:hypothetical protein
MDKHWLLIKPFEGIQIVNISRFLITTTPMVQKCTQSKIHKRIQKKGQGDLCRSFFIDSYETKWTQGLGIFRSTFMRSSSP